jgi:autotransporter translocation and assembly factor TamB
LPQRDVWAALLFGRPIAALSTDQARSADEMNAAAVDGGLSLATMYLLASTPVESVSYDPASQQFRAAVRLADGAALTVGSDLRSSSSVGFRYRLGRDWYVTTTLEDPFDFTKTKLATRLEWTKRY